MDAPFFAVAVPGVTCKVEYPWMKYWSLPVMPVVVVFVSLKVKFERVGAESVVVFTVAVPDELDPICVEPLMVAREKVPVKDFTAAIAVSRFVRCVEVSVMVRSAVPVDHDRPLMVR